MYYYYLLPNQAPAVDLMPTEATNELLTITNIQNLTYSIQI